MHKYVCPVIPADKSISFGIVEPLYRTFQAFHLRPLGHRTFLNPIHALQFPDIFRLLEEAVKRNESWESHKRGGYLRFLRVPHS
jgi:hypothetical protein